MLRIAKKTRAWSNTAEPAGGNDGTAAGKLSPKKTPAQKSGRKTTWS
jgi:hypothetical protein